MDSHAQNPQHRKMMRPCYASGKFVGALVANGLAQPCALSCCSFPCDTKPPSPHLPPQLIQIATMKKVNHPNCVQLHEVFDEPNKTYLVLDL